MCVISEGDTLLLHFKSIRSSGEIFENTYEGEPIKITLGQKQINPEFEKALIGKKEGDKITVVLPPEKAYGKFSKRLIIPIKRKKLNLENEPKEGDIITVDVLGKKCRVTVAAVNDTRITVDANHPLAGETMTYEIEVVKNLGGAK
ncbi:MAG: FKBP-type peptidyl-prolyl cis-trans isomerase [Methanocorpusculum sp.]|nr:FKBP-type peptidyl-prolyl cis-trans isomerase [Methanocorpusculum sp.]